MNSAGSIPVAMNTPPPFSSWTTISTLCPFLPPSTLHFLEDTSRIIPPTLKFLCFLVTSCCLIGVLRALRESCCGGASTTPYRHMRHRHKKNEAWRPSWNDPVRQLLFFSTGRRVTTDFLSPLAHFSAAVLIGLALVPGTWTDQLLQTLRAVKDDPLAGVVILGGTILLQDTLRNAVAGLELTTTHLRFDRNDRVRFHAAGIPDGVVRQINSKEVVLKCAGGHVFIPAALAVSLAVTVYDDEEEEEEDGTPFPAAKGRSASQNNLAKTTNRS